jgi:hypothetical protein
MTGKRQWSLVGFGAIAALLYALWRLLEARRRESGITWEPEPFPSPPRPRVDAVPDASVPRSAEVAAESTDAEPVEPAATDGAPASAAEQAAWVEPVEGACPATHPVKAKLSSGIFHAPGAQMYERTKADRCYADAEAAEADGLRASKR